MLDDRFALNVARDAICRAVSYINVRDIIYEDFVNYKKASMLIAMPNCNMKCNIEAGCEVCHNKKLLEVPIVRINEIDLIKHYINNRITHAVVFQGMEPLYNSPDDERLFRHKVNPYKVGLFAHKLRQFGCNDDVVIYTGFTEEELLTDNAIEVLKELVGRNLIIKFGRYLPGHEPHFDSVLGVDLASDNQYAKQIC